jgi:hypothetical protein
MGVPFALSTNNTLPVMPPCRRVTHKQHAKRTTGMFPHSRQETAVTIQPAEQTVNLAPKSFSVCPDETPGKSDYHHGL